MKDVSGSNALGHHTRWKNLVNGDYDDALVSEHSLLCKVLLWASSYDQLNVANLAAFELLVRRIQMIEYKKRGSMKDSTVDGLGQEDKIFLGTELAKGTICFSPKLRLHLASQLETEGKMLKGQRLAREERALLSNKKKK